MKIRKPYQLAKEEKKASREYKLASKYERKYGNPKLADVYDRIARQEEAHSRKIKKIMKI